MGKVLDALANDALRVEAGIDKRSPEHQKIYDEMLELQDEMEKRLGAEEKELFKKLLDLQFQEGVFYAQERFTFGFRLGSRIMVEALLDIQEFTHKDDSNND